MTVGLRWPRLLDREELSSYVPEEFPTLFLRCPADNTVDVDNDKTVDDCEDPWDEATDDQRRIHPHCHPFYQSPIHLKQSVRSLGGASKFACFLVSFTSGSKRTKIFLGRILLGHSFRVLLVLSSW